MTDSNRNFAAAGIKFVEFKTDLRRATVQDTCSKHAGITGVHSLACSSPIRKTPKRDGSLSRAGARMDFAKPFPPREKRMTEQDYVLQVN